MGKRQTLVAILVDNMGKARELLSDLRTYDRNSTEFTIVDAVFAEKGADSNVSIHQTADLEGTQGAIGGGVVGLIAGGVVFGPLGAAVGTAVGSVLAGVYASLRDSGMNNRVMTNIVRDMEPNQTTLILLLEGSFHPAMSSLFNQHSARLFYTNLPTGAEDRIREVVDNATATRTLNELSSVRVRDEELRRAYERDMPVYVVDEDDRPVRPASVNDTPVVADVPFVPMAPGNGINPAPVVPVVPMVAEVMHNDVHTPDPEVDASTHLRLHSDDLTQITEVTPEIEQVLRDNNIKTFSQLSHASSSDLRNMLSQAGHHHPVSLPTWTEQAWLATQQKVDELHELQQEIYAQLNS